MEDRLASVLKAKGATPFVWLSVARKDIARVRSAKLWSGVKLRRKFREA